MESRRKSRYEGVFLWLALHVGMPVGCKEQWGGILTDMGRCKFYLKFHFYEIKYNFDGEFNS